MLRSFLTLAILLGQPVPLLGAGCPAGVSPEATVPARLKSKVEAKYTQEAFEASLTGTALLNLKVDENGVPVQVKLVKWTGERDAHGLDKAAIEAVRQWRFYPKVAFCVAMPSYVTVQIPFPPAAQPRTGTSIPVP